MSTSCVVVWVYCCPALAASYETMSGLLRVNGRGKYGPYDIPTHSLAPSIDVFHFSPDGRESRFQCVQGSVSVFQCDPSIEQVLRVIETLLAGCRKELSRGLDVVLLAVCGSEKLSKRGTVNLQIETLQPAHISKSIRASATTTEVGYVLESEAKKVRASA